MKILLFHQYFLWNNEAGGSRWTQFVKYFTRDPRTSVDVIAGNIHYATGARLGGNRFFSKDTVDARVRIFRTWTYAGYNSNFFGRLAGYLSYTASSFFASLLIRRPDVIVVTSPPLFAALAAWALSKIKRVPLVFEVRDLWPESAVATGVVKNPFLIRVMAWMEVLLYRSSALIVPLTPAFREDIVRRFPEVASRVHVITNSADFDLIPERDGSAEIRRAREWGSRRVFGYFGAHGLANDLEQILRVADRLKARKDIHFVLVGDGMRKAALKELASELVLPNVEFVDSVNKTEVFDYMRACDVCVATLKRTDVFKTVYPNKVFDYMACGRPVLVTIDGITRDLVRSAECGEYSTPEDAHELEGAVLRLAEAPGERLREMGQKGQSYVRARFDREVLAREYAEILRRSGPEAGPATR